MVNIYDDDNKTIRIIVIFLIISLRRQRNNELNADK